VRVVVAAVASMLLFGGIALASDLLVDKEARRLDRVTVLPVPEEVAAAVTDRGDPVWVVSHAEGGASVLSAVNPHLDTLVVWCAQARVFVQEGPASMFDDDGRYLSGPAPQGLAPYAVEASVDDEGRQVLLVGERLPPPGRDIAPARPSGPLCDWTPEERVVAAERHDLSALYGEPTAPEAARPSHQLQLLDARLHADGQGNARLCTPRLEDGCPTSAPVIRSFFHDLGHLDHMADLRGWVDGPMLARRQAHGFHDVAMPWIPISYLRFEPTEPLDPFSARAAGRLVALEQHDGVWVAQLGQPVVPEGNDDEGRVELPASDRWEVADELGWWDAGVVVPDDVAPGSRLPQTIFRTEQVAQRLAAGEELYVALDVDRDGVVRGAELPSPPDEEYWRREGSID
jgi:hypothetical protein